MAQPFAVAARSTGGLPALRTQKCRANLIFILVGWLVRRGKGNEESRTVQELLGHRDVATAQIYTHVLNRGPSAVLSPFDALGPQVIHTEIKRRDGR